MRGLLWSFACGVAICLSSGCATTPPPDARLEISTATAPEKVAPLLADQGRKCWHTKVSPFTTGLGVASYFGEDGHLLLSVYHVNWARGIAEEPFFVLRTRSNGTGTSISVVERPMSCSIFHGCLELELTGQLRKWLDGDLACTPLGPKLLFDGLW